ncbi:MAG: exo-alpha-sialidase [Verrucomicrobia bacterium]|nr:exo-alpha-sialidase [Verrucomicrobiota bacterium]
MKTRMIDRGVVYRSEETARQSSAFAGICVLPSGRWLCSFASAPLKSKAVRECLITCSDDCGSTWSDPISPFRTKSVQGKPGDFRSAYLTPLDGHRVLATIIWVDQTDPSLPYFNEKTEGLLDTRIFLSISEDEGMTWSKPRLISVPPFHIPTVLTGPTLLLPSGEWACQFELNKHYHDTTPWRHCSVLAFSKDQGKTWSERVLVSDDPELRFFYWDQRPGVLADGRILDVFWTFDRKPAVYLNIHARESRDNGRTWSGMWDCGIPGQPAPPISLSDGRIVLAYMDRTAAPALKLRTSSDGGRAWPQDTELILYEAKLPTQTWDKQTMQDAWAEMGKFSVGLPATALTSQGDILIVYYAGTYADRTGIEWVQVRES